MDNPHDPSAAVRWRKIQDLFDRVVELPVEERPRRLDEACAGDPELRRVVASLLIGHDRSDEVLYDLEHPEAAGDRPRDHDRHTAPESRDLIGRTISHYRVVERLGGGGMGVVYRAEDVRLGRSVALKFLPDVQSQDPEVKRRFLQEAQAASGLDHPNVCAIHEIGEAEDGGLFIAMRHYPGESLRERLRRGPFLPDLVLDLAIQVAEGLAAVHREGIIHRDIKPANLMLTEDGTIKILDFGLAKMADVTLTQAGRTMGTVAYMSPEQVRAEPLDARTDLWSLGVVLYEMMAGRRPFRGDREASVIYAILGQEPEPPGAFDAGCGGALERVVLRLLRKAPAARYQDAGALLADLEAIRAGRQPRNVVGDAAPSRARIRRRRLAVAVGALLALTGGIWGARRLSTGTAQPATAVRLSTIAVFPFTVSGNPDLGYLREGMVDLLSLKIDATTRVRSVTPRVLVDHIERLPPDERDPAKYLRNVPGGGWAMDVANRFLAQYFIVGTVSGAGEGVRLSATMYDPPWWEPVAEAAVTAPAGSDLIGAIDHLADALLARVPGAESRPIPSLSALATGSLPAMRAYLDGRRADRRLDPLSGNEFRRRAVAIDSTFALAWFDLALQRVSLGGAALERAEMLSDRLPPRERDHLVALRALLEGRAPEAERLYRRLLARYPDDVEAWGMLGEVLLTYGGFYGRPIEDARRVFERVVALDPNVQRATYRLLNIAALEGRLGAFDSIATWVSEWSPAGSEDARLYTILGRLAGASPAERTTLLGEVEASASEAFLNGVSYYARQLGDVATLVWRNEARTDPVNAPGVQDRGHYQLALLESARGRFDVARRHLAALAEFNPGWALVLRASIAALPHSPDSAVELIPLRRRVSEWDALSPPLSADSHIGGWADLILYLQGRLSLRLGDQAATRAVAKELEERGAFQDRGIPAAQLASALVALLAWQRDEPERALTALADAEVDLPLILRDSPFHTQALNRYVRGEVLYGLGRYRDALPWFESLNPGVEDDFMWLYFAPAQRRIAEIYERVGDPSRAAEHYRRFLELWRDADPALRPTVLEARRRMDALSNAAVVGTD